MRKSSDTKYDITVKKSQDFYLLTVLLNAVGVVLKISHNYEQDTEVYFYRSAYWLTL